MRISKNFEMREFAVSASFPHLVNPVPEMYMQNVIALVERVLQPICDETGWHDEITSGYRSPMLNRAVGGSKTSQHMRGEAADNIFFFKRNGKRVNVESYFVAKQVLNMGLDFDQMILYNTFVHISYSRYRNRKQLLYDRRYRGKRI